MKGWFFWAGIGLIIGGAISLALNLGVQENLSDLEDLSGYSLSWIVVGIALIVFSIVKRKREVKS